MKKEMVFKRTLFNLMTVLKKIIFALILRIKIKILDNKFKYT